MSESFQAFIGLIVFGALCAGLAYGAGWSRGYRVGLNRIEELTSGLRWLLTMPDQAAAHENAAKLLRRRKELE